MFSTNAGKGTAIKILEKSFKCHFILTTDLSQKAEKQCDLILMTEKHAQTWVSRTKTDHITKQQKQYVPQFCFFLFFLRLP